MSRENQEISEEKREVGADQKDGLLDIGLFVDMGWSCIRRYWVWMLVIISVSSSIAWFSVNWSYTPTYTASTTFIVNTNTAYSYNQEYYNKATANQLSKTFPYIISNSALQRMIEEDLGVSSIPGTIKAEAMEGTNLITISATAYSPQTAYDILQSVLETYPKVARPVIGDTSMNVVEETGVPTSANQAMNNSGVARRGFAIGVLICFAWIALYVMGRKTIRKEEEMKTMLNIRCLASVPKVQFKKTRSVKKNQILLDNTRVSYSFTESYRTIRTRVERVINEAGSKVFLVSSASPGEGKTTVSVNLALSLAQKGKKVVLIDLDLRNPSVMRAFGKKEKRYGIAEVLQGKVPLNEVIVPYGDTTLKIIPGGKPVQLTAKLLNSQALELIFKVLQAQADCIIIDTPPSGLLSDAAQIAKFADEGIFVVRQDFSSIDRIKEGIEMLTDTELHIAGCILNYAETGIMGYGSYGYRRYGKYGKYGYSE